MAANNRFAVAVHVVTYLAHEHDRDQPLSSAEIAESVDTHPVVIRRVLGALARAGIVKSTPGKRGGARLARNPARITLLDIYRSTEECGLFAARRMPSGRCEIACRMESLLDPVFDATQKAAEAALKKITVARLLK